MFNVGSRFNLRLRQLLISFSYTMVQRKVFRNPLVINRFQSSKAASASALAEKSNSTNFHFDLTQPNKARSAPGIHHISITVGPKKLLYYNFMIIQEGSVKGHPALAIF